jgi:hypothetical protein
MAAEIQFEHHQSGANLYAVIRNSQGYVWNGSAFLVQVNASWASYAVPLTETPTSGKFYVADFPASVQNGAGYSVTIYQRVGGSPSLTADARLKSGTLTWTGGETEDDGVSLPSAGAV